ncbi:COG4315 family predicted lipoprotein [Pelagibacterium xiamenense]|uniref:COG4315 family predicted lipoprotein n=1 Tax=Pelagibacterium xiamenense TaxID=2901140 RepID=UPI003F6E8FFF
MSRAALAAGALLAATGLAVAAPDVTTVESDLGPVLADSEGMVLYTFRNDEEGVSNCYDQCAVNWPPFFAEDGAMAEGAYTLVERTDGTVMWAKDGWPLYYWINDTEPGMTSGDGVGGVWDVARP